MITSYFYHLIAIIHASSPLGGKDGHYTSMLIELFLPGFGGAWWVVHKVTSQSLCSTQGQVQTKGLVSLSIAMVKTLEQVSGGAECGWTERDQL